MVEAKPTDFGIGQVVSAEALSGVTRAGFTQTIVGSTSSQTGTQLYMAPELLAGKPATTRSDIYSLGATIHLALTRRDPRLEPPFSFVELPLRRINPAVSQELEVIVNRALEYDPTMRFNSASEMKDALLAVARKTGVLVHQGPQTGPVKTSGIKPLWSFKTEDEIRGTPTIYRGRCMSALMTITCMP